MLNKAIDKIDKEIEKWKDEIYVEVIGEYLLQQLNLHPEYAEKLLNEKKTLQGALKAIENVARKRKKPRQSCAIVSDAEAFALVLEYYGIKAEGSAPTPTPPAPTTPAAKPTPVKQLGLDLDIDDLLG